MLSDTLLVVDDNKINRDVLVKRLSTEGYTVMSAESGRAALDVVEEQEIALILLDLVMPDMNGIEVLDELRLQYDGLRLPVLMVSADTDTPQMVAALDQGANDYITKPVDYALLLAKIRRHLSLRTSASSASKSIPLERHQVKSGVMLGHYLLHEKLGMGGMGTVFRASDTRLMRDVALKVMSEAAISERALKRFLREARAVARVSHSGVVTIHDVATEPVPYITMELLEGELLSNLPEPPSVQRSLFLIRQVLRALQAVHEAGITHRDLKPSNIMILPQQRVKVMDFGLAKFECGQDLRLTDSGSFWGTPQFMAPEQLQSDSGMIDGQTDIFAVAGILYELVAHQPPFCGKSLPRLITAILYHEVRPPKELNPELSDELSAAILTGLQKDKSLRFKTCQELLEALDGLSG